jgi:serine/threonine protein kinase
MKRARNTLVIARENAEGEKISNNILNEIAICRELSVSQTVNEKRSAASGQVAMKPFPEIYAAWQDKNSTYLVAEHLDGGNLAEYLHLCYGDISQHVCEYSRSGLPQQVQSRSAATLWVRRMQSLFRQVVIGIARMHARNITHGNLSIEACVLSRDTLTVKLSKFDLAKKFKDNRDSFDACANDIWCLGVVLCTMLTGETPFRNDVARQYALNGKLKRVLISKGQLPLFTSDAIDLVEKIFRPEKLRLKIADVCAHPFVSCPSRATIVTY